MMTFRMRNLRFAAFATSLIAIPLLAGTAFAQTAAQSTAPLSQTQVMKAGHAYRHVRTVNKHYTKKLAHTPRTAARQQTKALARQKAVGKIHKSGLTVHQYKHVLHTAHRSPVAHRQLLDAAGTPTTK
jgi:hypothetical protein